MYGWARDLWPINRSLTGEGVRSTLRYLQSIIPNLQIHEVATGTQAFDWTVPQEWNVKAAWIETPSGEKIAEYSKNNLHLMGYSTPVNAEMDLGELKKRIFSLPSQPSAIPYITSYYQKNWAFCLADNQLQALKPGTYKVVIDSELKTGSLTYGELILPGETPDEIFFSTYICHPSMANNELSGPVVTAALAQWLLGLKKRKFTYRFLFGPETIGSIVYLSQHLQHLKSHVQAGYVVTCVGDENDYSFLPSRLGETLADRLTARVLEEMKIDYKKYSFSDRGSDERQFCSALVDLPMVSVMRSKYGVYPEYHTSLDDLDYISPKGLQGAFDILKRCVSTLESSAFYICASPCEPQLGKRGLYPQLSTVNTKQIVRTMMDILAYCDGKHDIYDLAKRAHCEVSEAQLIIDKLLTAKVIRNKHEDLEINDQANR